MISGGFLGNLSSFLEKGSLRFLLMMRVLAVGPRRNGWILEEGSTPFTEFYLLWLGIFVRRYYLNLSLPNFGTSLQFSHTKNKTTLYLCFIPISHSGDASTSSDTGGELAPPFS